MFMRVGELRCKDVINIRDGTRLGCADDFDIDLSTARVVTVIVYGRLRLFGLLGRGKDIVIKWGDIKVIGEDTILIDCPPFDMRRRRPRSR
jgi:YlmC/YmxH family sporulation protein